MRFRGASLGLCVIAGQFIGGSGTALEAYQAAVVACYHCHVDRTPQAAALSTVQTAASVQGLFARVRAECCDPAPGVLAGVGEYELRVREFYQEYCGHIDDLVESVRKMVRYKNSFVDRFPRRRNPSVAELNAMREFVAHARAILRDEPSFEFLLSAEMDRWQQVPNDVHLSQERKQVIIDEALRALTRAEDCVEGKYARMIADLADTQVFMLSAVSELNDDCLGFVNQAVMKTDAGNQWVLDRDFSEEEQRVVRLNQDMTTRAARLDDLHKRLDEERANMVADLLRAGAEGLTGPLLLTRARELAAGLIANLGDSIAVIHEFRNRVEADPFALTGDQVVVLRDRANADLQQCIDDHLARVAADLANESVESADDLFSISWICFDQTLDAARLFSADVPADASSQDFVESCRRIAVYPSHVMRALEAAREEFIRRQLPRTDLAAAREFVAELSAGLLQLPGAADLLSGELQRWRLDPFSTGEPDEAIPEPVQQQASFYDGHPGSDDDEPANFGVNRYASFVDLEPPTQHAIHPRPFQQSFGGIQARGSVHPGSDDDEPANFGLNRYASFVDDHSPTHHAIHPHGVQQGLGQFIMQFADEDVEFLCEHRGYLSELIRRSVTTQAAAAPLARWEELHGSRLLALAAIGATSCQAELLRAAVALATSIPGASSTAAAFAVDSGLGAFCEQNAVAIRGILDTDQPWRLLSTGAWRWAPTGPHRGSLVSGFAADLPRYCPQVLTSIESKAAVLHQYFFRQRLFAHLNRPHIEVDRAHVFESSVAFLNGPVGQLLTGLPHVSFEGEPGMDAGGLGRDWFATLFKALFETRGSLFKVREGAHHLVLDEGKVCTDETRELYRATGRFLAYILASRLPASIGLPVPFFALLLDSQVSREVLCQQSEVECNAINDIQIAIETGDEETKRNAMNLDHDERILTLEEYIQRRIDYYVTPLSDAKMEAIRSGFNDLVAIDYVRAFIGPHDLRHLISVDEEIDAEDLIVHSRIVFPLTAQSPEVGWLWNWLRAADQDMRRKYVQFVTGLPRLPPGGCGALDRAFEIRRGGNDLAPQSHTCFYQLDLPNYGTEAQLQEWLPVAFSSGGFGMI